MSYVWLVSVECRGEFPLGVFSCFDHVIKFMEPLADISPSQADWSRLTIDATAEEIKEAFNMKMVYTHSDPMIQVTRMKLDTQHTDWVNS